MSYYTSETVTMKADDATCEALKKALNPAYEKFAKDGEMEIENGKFSCLIYGNNIEFKPLLLQFTKEHKNVLVQHSILDCESDDEYPKAFYFYKNGKFKYIESEFPEFDEAKELPDID